MKNPAEVTSKISLILKIIYYLKHVKVYFSNLIIKKDSKNFTGDLFPYFEKYD